MAWILSATKWRNIKNKEFQCMHKKGYIKYLWLIEIKLISISDSKKYNIFFFIYLSQYQSFPIEYACECKPNKNIYIWCANAGKNTIFGMKQLKAFTHQKKTRDNLSEYFQRNPRWPKTWLLKLIGIYSVILAAILEIKFKQPAAGLFK